jgi:hypothetical protein
MASLRGAISLSAPTVPVFGVAVFIALLAVLARFLGIHIPWVSDHVAETLLIAFAVLSAGVMFKGV